MKRDNLVAVLCIFLTALCCLIGAKQVIPTSLSLPTPTSRILILDAGHGGEDGGALSASGTKESDINLSVVLRTEALVAFLGIDTILTRSTDVSIHDSDCDTLREKKISDLKNRSKLINSCENAMVISVHQNTFRDPKYKGAQVFYANGDISRQWGELAQGMLRATVDQHNKRKASHVPDSVYLFQHIGCPAILIECGFLSNGEEASLLLTQSYQKKLALALTGAYIKEIQMIPNPMGGG